MKHPRRRDGLHAPGGVWREQYNVRITRMLGQVGMTMDLPGVHPHRLRRDVEAHVLGKRGMLLRITIRGFRPPHYRPRREGSCRKGKEKHRILSADGRSVRKDPADAPIRGAISKPADQYDCILYVPPQPW